MNKLVVKRFSTVETILLMLKHREVMFRVILASDKSTGNALPELEFLRIVAGYQMEVSADVAKEVALVFDWENLIKAKVLNDRRHASGVTKLWFNPSVIDIFRLCKISLFRPLTKVSLNAAMTPIWSIVEEIENQRISIIPATEEYDDWLGEISHRVTELLGKVKANIAKLENVGDNFQTSIASESLEITKEKYKQASTIYRREIEPLSIFLAKDTMYEQGQGIVKTLDTLIRYFSEFGDTESQNLMNQFQIQFLDLFKPIKQVADNVSVYLRKTQSAIVEHNAIESAYGVLRAAYEETLSYDKRNKFINLRNLSELGALKSINAIGRITASRLDKTPSYLNNVFNELAYRNATAASDGKEDFIFEESIDRNTSRKLKHSIRLNKWVEEFAWTENEDYIALAYKELNSTLPGFSIPDLLEISGKLHTSAKYQTVLTNDFKTIEDNQHKLTYRVRFLNTARQERQ